ncbi:hypothetical protein OIO90_001679 [Microbotryomycetes sp. JL221]|nr:hypothetical protein OIO90_001679 [Microbotryomycetes sp. JL221]
MTTDFEIAYVAVDPPQVGVNGYDGFKPGQQTILKAGSTRQGWDGGRTAALTQDILLDHDVEIVVRDGARLYTDIYRPPNSDKEPVPCLIMWSPYGSFHGLPYTTWRCGIRNEDLDGWEKFEGLRPGLWCPRGYAIASVDIRGTGHSDGNVQVMGENMAEDGYDVIEALAKMPWCNGKIGMGGNSFLAISQWFIAAKQPPSLKCIAPFEGCGDLYREQFVRGGVYAPSTQDLINAVIVKGPNGTEDFTEMYLRQPLMSPYWADKRAKMKDIKVPALITGSDSSQIHTMGSIRAFMEIDAPTWIRWSGVQEWPDLYCNPESDKDLTLFYDHYLKGIDNGWEKTPRVRWSLLQFGDRDPINNVQLDNFPPSQTQYKDFYFDHKGTLSDSVPETSGCVSYLSNGPEANSVSFDIQFNKKTILLGISKCQVWMSCQDQDDFYTFVTLKKLDEQGKILAHQTIPRDRGWVQTQSEIEPQDRTNLLLHYGSMGILRASRRKFDPNQNVCGHPNWPLHSHDEEQKVNPGDIVKLDIGIWVTSVVFYPGESLRVELKGEHKSNEELDVFTKKRPDESTLNHGTHNVFFGGQYPSKVVLPFVELES